MNISFRNWWKSRWKYEQQLALKAKAQPKLYYAHVRRNRHLKKNIIGLKGNEGEINFTPSSQAELLKEYYSTIVSKMMKDVQQPCPFQ